MKYARIEGSSIVEFPVAADGFSMQDSFTEGFVSTLVKVPDTAQIGMELIGGTWSQPVLGTVDLDAYAAAKRYALEVGGFTFKGHPIATDANSQSKIGNVALGANIIGAAFSTSFKCSDGSFFTLDHDDAIAMATAVMNFISSCFDAEAAVAAGIASGTMKAPADIDAASWPANS